MLFVSVVIIIDTTCFLFFSSHIHFSKTSSQIFYFHPQIFSRTDIGSTCKKSFENMLLTVLEGIICTFVRAGLRESLKISRKFKNFYSFSSFAVYWICLSFGNSRDCSLDLNRAWMSSTYSLCVFEARFKINASAMALCSKLSWYYQV